MNLASRVLHTRSGLSVGIAFFCMAILFRGCAPRKCAIPELPNQEACERRLKRLADAIARYRKANGNWPRDFISPNGNTHSWRMLLAPYCVSSPDHVDILAKIGYRFDEPWNSGANSKAIQSISLSAQFVCPSESKWGHYPFTSYLWLVRSGGEDNMIGPLRPTAIIVVESADCRIRFAEPRDVLWQDLWEGASPFGVGKLNSLHPQVVNALRADGTVVSIPKNIEKDDLRLLLNGEK